MVRGLPPLEVKLWGDYACFTRPEMKVERVTYPVMTPSAARGALEAILWKPQIAWRIEEIHVLRPIAYASILRNEINDRQSERTARGWARNGGGYDAADRRSRAQRHTLALRDVAYVVRAQLVLQDGIADDIAKYRDQFRRRVARGQCFATPYHIGRHHQRRSTPTLIEESARSFVSCGTVGRESHLPLALRGLSSTGPCLQAPSLSLTNGSRSHARLATPLPA